MSLYNMIHGTQAAAPIVLALLQPINPGRTRDAWVEKNSAGELRLVVYTRNGGGNREHWSDDREAGPECDCTGCTMTYALPAHPLYIEDRDDAYDSTYATIYFRVPGDVAERLRAMGAPEGAELATIAQDAPDMAERWGAALAAIGGAR